MSRVKIDLYVGINLFFLDTNNVFFHFTVGSFPMTICLFKVMYFNCFEALFINFITFVT